jgi:hypothetical protein
MEAAAINCFTVGLSVERRRNKMGFLQATEMARMTDLEAGLTWHLQANHYPPVSKSFIPACKEAISAAQKGEWDKKIKMPNGLVRSAAFIIEGLHLEPWIDQEEE